MLCLLGAGGYVGYAMTTRWGGADASKLQMIGFDMGGTSTGGRCMLGAGSCQAAMAGVQFTQHADCVAAACVAADPC